MAFNQTHQLVVGTLGRSSELRELPNDNAVINFSLAVTPRKKQGNDWVDDETIWTNVVMWGRDARAFDANKFTPGTQLVVYGVIRAVRRQAFTTKAGVEVPERVEQEVNADWAAVAVSPFTTITVNRLQKNGNGSTVPSAPAQPARQVPAAQAPAKKSAPKAAPVPDPSIDQTTDDSDPFGDSDPFADTGTDDTAGGDDDDPFANMPF